MSPAEESIERRLLQCEHALFGVHGEDGLADQLRGLRRDFRDWRKEDTQRREGEQERKINTNRAVALALFAAVVSLIGVIASLLIVVAAST